MISNNKQFISGVFVGMLVMLLFVANIKVFSWITKSALDRIEESSRGYDRCAYNMLKQGLNLDFETQGQDKVFERQESQADVSAGVAASGAQSLMVEFPAGSRYPGLNFELYGKDCLDWSGMNQFSLKAFNATAVKKNLIVQLRSGNKYPKKGFKKEFELTSGKWTDIVIKRSELESRLQLDKISHLTLFMAEPATSFIVYIDDIKVD